MNMSTNDITPHLVATLLHELLQNQDDERARYDRVHRREDVDGGW